MQTSFIAVDTLVVYNFASFSTPLPRVPVVLSAYMYIKPTRAIKLTRLKAPDILGKQVGLHVLFFFSIFFPKYFFQTYINIDIFIMIESLIPEIQ